MYRRMIGFGQGEIQLDYDVLRAVYNVRSCYAFFHTSVTR